MSGTTENIDSLEFLEISDLSLREKQIIIDKVKPVRFYVGVRKAMQFMFHGTLRVLIKEWQQKHRPIVHANYDRCLAGLDKVFNDYLYEQLLPVTRWVNRRRAVP